MATYYSDVKPAMKSFPGEDIALLDELAALKAENERLAGELRQSNGYIRAKVNHLLDVMGTIPLREEELDDHNIREFDPLGIIFESFRHILASLKEKNIELQLLHDESVAIFASAQVGIMVVDRDFKIISCNKRMRSIFFNDLNDGEIYGNFCNKLVCNGMVSEELCAAHNILTNDGLASLKGWEVRGHVFDVEAAPINDATGKVERIVLVYKDITDLKKAENELNQLNGQLEQRVIERTAQFQEVNNELESFCYSISHDLRAPLRHISGFTNILLEDYSSNLNAEGQEFLNRICTVVSRMSGMIDDLLSISRVSQSKITFVTIDLSRLAEKTAELFHKSNPERAVKIEIAPRLLTMGDPSLIELVMENLIGNAWKYTALSCNAVIQVGKCSVNGKDAFFVKDNGVGFDMAYSERLFRVFERLHGIEFEGSGIGLATVQRIISRHRGEVWAEGAVGSGATIYFTLPFLDKYII